MYIKTLKILVGLIIVLAVITLLFRFILAVTKPETIISLNQSSVITKMQSLSKIETSSFTIEKIIEGGSKGNAFQNIIFGDTILLIAHGTVVGGFDLGKIQESDVTVTGTKLHIVLPAPEILYSRLDNSQTKVYDRKLGLLTKGDKDLESQVRFAAETSIREAACTGGVLDQASTNLRQQLSVLFLSLGFNEVTFEIPKAVVCR
jgi:Protein of unknown function (DUF4230)